MSVEEIQLSQNSPAMHQNSLGGTSNIDISYHPATLFGTDGNVGLVPIAISEDPFPNELVVALRNHGSQIFTPTITCNRYFVKNFATLQNNGCRPVRVLSLYGVTLNRSQVYSRVNCL
ncbi:hypothetical protein RF11_08630 [Thelohanellus kitauei]|uniref:Uncharacterized protein n=1 Tax=Thelohanellus kitauei TaxID=669202 RepID=A0A0C2M7P4_THEKT|nr:hypothetical protein RF11_08630 [Thelohanellus kitauei]